MDFLFDSLGMATLHRYHTCQAFPGRRPAVPCLVIFHHLVAHIADMILLPFEEPVGHCLTRSLLAAIAGE